VSGPRVLVVDDEPSLLVALRIHLSARGFDVTTVTDGGSALRALDEVDPQVVVLDLGLPDRDGTAVLADIRRRGPVPVIVLSARTDAADKVGALDAGADDYVTKPFGMDELLARIRAAIRRAATPPREDEPVVTADFTVDLKAKRVFREGVPVHLTPTEWAVVELLVRRRGTLVSQAELLREVWGSAYSTETNYLRVYLAQLRRKLEPDPGRPRHLLTEPGQGYRFEA
jgi:two-component system KDP operon response regulator KdpE